jgi:serine phosphatase RsbU (regulator of sigma subunit)
MCTVGHEASGKPFFQITLKLYDCHTHSLFAWLISHQPAVFFSHNKPATSNQPTVLFSQNKPASAISHQPNEQAAKWKT